MFRPKAIQFTALRVGGVSIEQRAAGLPEIVQGGIECRQVHHNARRNKQPVMKQPKRLKAKHTIHRRPKSVIYAPLQRIKAIRLILPYANICSEVQGQNDQ